MTTRGGKAKEVTEIPAEQLPAMLRAGGRKRDAASEQLRGLLVRAALAYLARQRYPVEAFGADDYETVAEDFAQESLTIIMRQLGAFRGESRFTTWAYRIVINLIADEYRRRAWRRRPLAEAAELEASRWTATARPEANAERRAIWQLIEEIIRDELTPRQRKALVGRVVDGKPLVVLAEELHTNKDNVYKLLHDARRHMKRALQARGITEAELLAALEQS